jgi:guanosine-3',5'-bis(diphosphate) 3'-pyrophosphohydrolase
LIGLVDELSDDVNLKKMERKRLQIEHAPRASYKAKLIKLADKLYNLRDLKRCTPKGWSKDRVQEYFVFAIDVVAGLRGINDPMEQELDKLLRERDLLTS